MKTPDKYYNETKNAFATSDEKKIIHKLNDIRQNGTPSIIPLIVELLEKHNKDAIEKVVLEIMGQLKDNECRPFVIESIKRLKTDEIRKKLIMTCWQSGLNYSDYIIDFAREFIDGNFEVSIESFTVIEEWIHETPKETVVACKTYLKENVHKIPNDKKAYYSELVKLVESHI